MKVLLVLEPAFGGAFQAVKALALSLIQRRIPVALAYSLQRTDDGMAGLCAEVEAAGGMTLDLKVGNAPRPSDLRALFALRSLVKAWKPTVIHAHSSKAGGLVRLLPFLGVRAAYLYTPHAYYKMDGGVDRKSRVFHLIERVLGHVGYTINLGPAEARFATERIGISPNRQIVIPNGVDSDVFHPVSPEERSRLRSEFGIPSSAMVLGSIGRTSEQKDPLTMYRALLLAKATTPDLYLVHVGRGELDDVVEAFIEEHQMSSWVQRIPFLSEPASFYQVLDGFLLPSRFEGMSLAVLEAISTGLPLVLTCCPGNIDFAAFNLSHLFWCDPGDAESVACAIGRWKERLRAGTASNHYAIAQKTFAQAACLERIVDTYRSFQPKAAPLPAKKPSSALAEAV